MNQALFTKISVGCGIGSLIIGGMTTVISGDLKWLMIGVISVLLSLVRVWTSNTDA